MDFHAASETAAKPNGSWRDKDSKATSSSHAQYAISYYMMSTPQSFHIDTRLHNGHATSICSRVASICDPVANLISMALEVGSPPGHTRRQLALSMTRLADDTAEEVPTLTRHCVSLTHFHPHTNSSLALLLSVFSKFACIWRPMPNVHPNP